MKTKYIILAFASLLLSATTLKAQRQDDRQAIRVKDFELVRHNGQVTVDFVLEIGAKAAKSENTLTVIPLLAAGELTRELTPVIIRGRKARILYERRFIASPRTAGIHEAEAMKAKNGEVLKYHTVIPYEEWMAGAAMLLDGVDEGCCSAMRTNLGLIAENLMVTAEPETTPAYTPSSGDRLAEMFPFVRPAGSGEPYSREGITVHFHQGRHNIDQNYRRNRQSLIDILSVVEEIERSGDSNVESIVIAGFASPEGTVQHNARLSERRAESVRKFIYDNSALRADRLRIYAGGEDWEGLRELVASSQMQGRQTVLDIIDHAPLWGSRDEDGREADLKRLYGGEIYRYMYENFYPELREAAYITIYYENK